MRITYGRIPRRGLCLSARTPDSVRTHRLPRIPSPRAQRRLSVPQKPALRRTGTTIDAHTTAERPLTRRRDSATTTSRRRRSIASRRPPRAGSRAPPARSARRVSRRALRRTPASTAQATRYRPVAVRQRSHKAQNATALRQHKPVQTPLDGCECLRQNCTNLYRARANLLRQSFSRAQRRAFHRAAHHSAAQGWSRLP